MKKTLRTALIAVLVTALVSPGVLADPVVIRLDNRDLGKTAALSSLALGLVLVPFDQAIYDGMGQIPGGDSVVWKGISLVGSPIAALGTAALLTVADVEMGEDLSRALLFNGLVTMALKSAVGMARPSLGIGPVISGPTVDDDFSAFPSGHTSSAFAAATVVADYYPEYSKWAYLAAGLVGISRIFEGAHWPSNVVFGAGLGYLSARLALEYGK